MAHHATCKDNENFCKTVWFFDIRADKVDKYRGDHRCLNDKYETNLENDSGIPNTT